LTGSPRSTDIRTGVDALDGFPWFYLLGFR
jgi:hypothetical protein